MLAGFSFSLLIFRIFATHSVFYGFLIWNLVLSVVPFLISSSLLLSPKIHNRKILLLTASLVWLLFLPNAPYIVTDFLHFKNQNAMPGWFDLLMLTSFSWSGIAFGFVSITDMQKIWEHKFGSRISGIFIFASCMLSGFGIYLGRFLRYNSWDILSHPIDLLTDIPGLLLQLKAIGFSIGYGLFVYLSYRFFKAFARQ